MVDLSDIERIERNEIIVDLLEDKQQRKADNEFVIDLFRFLFPDGRNVNSVNEDDQPENSSQ